MASRGWGARTALVTLNRGEAGDNAIGAELFDALGLIRTDELARAAQYYGLDEQYFTGVADYGFSKRLDEAFAEWDRDALLRDSSASSGAPARSSSSRAGRARRATGMASIRRLARSRRRRSKRPAIRARFPELEQEGLRAWRVPKLYLGGARENEVWHVRVDPGEYDPVLGDSYQNLGRLGLEPAAFANQRPLQPGSADRRRCSSRVSVPRRTRTREAGLFDGLDTSRWPAPSACSAGPRRQERSSGWRRSAPKRAPHGRVLVDRAVCGGAARWRAD